MNDPAPLEIIAIPRDPVCGMTVDPGADGPRSIHDGKTYHFCSERCQTWFDTDPPSFLTAVDPVCGMSVDLATARFASKHNGASVFFCSERCQEKFAADPDAYADGRPAPEPMPEGTLFTCPMDPEIVQEGPGDCPICGMALEPMSPTADVGPNPELIDFRRRFAIGLTFTIPVLILSMGPMFGLPVKEWIGNRGKEADNDRACFWG